MASSSAETPELTWTTIPRKIEGPDAPQPPPCSPYPVSYGVIDEGRPQEREEDKGGELHPLGEGAHHQGRVIMANMAWNIMKARWAPSRRTLNWFLPHPSEPIHSKFPIIPYPASGPKESE